MARVWATCVRVMARVWATCVRVMARVWATCVRVMARVWATWVRFRARVRVGVRIRSTKAQRTERTDVEMSCKFLTKKINKISIETSLKFKHSKIDKISIELLDGATEVRERQPYSSKEALRFCKLCTI